MKKETKIQRVEELRKLLKENASYIVADFKGITVNSINELRKSLYKNNINLFVVKNNLIKLVLKENNQEDIAEKFVGTNAVAFCGDDPVSAAKMFKDYAKNEPKFDIKFGVLEDNIIGKEEIEQLAKLPDRLTLITQFAMLLNTPLVNFARLLKEPISGFARALNQLSEQKEN